MGREIRMVPPNWEHPERNPEHDRHGRGGYQPLHDQHFDDAFADWLERFDRVRRGDMDEWERECYPRGLADWLMDAGQPCDPTYYRPYKDDEATWFQLYETVSEGTPVSPPFETKQELADYLAQHGDFWDQDRCTRPIWTELYGGTYGVSAWGKERAEAFVNAGWAPSAVIQNGKITDGKFAVGKMDPQG